MQGLNFAVLCTLHGYVLVSIDNDVLKRIISKQLKAQGLHVLLSICHPHRHVFRESRIQVRNVWIICDEPFGVASLPSLRILKGCGNCNDATPTPVIARFRRSRSNPYVAVSLHVWVASLRS